MMVAFGYAGLVQMDGTVVSILFGLVYFVVGGIGGLVWIFSAEKASGAMPLARVPSYALALRPARGRVEDLARSLRTGPDPVIGRIESGRLLLDLRTVHRDEHERLAASIARALEEEL